MAWQVFGTKTSPTAMSTLDTQSGNLAQWSLVDCTASGTNVITLSPTLAGYVAPSYANYVSYRFVAANTTSGAVTLRISALAALKVLRADGSSQAGSGDVVSGQTYLATYNSAADSATGGWYLTLLGEPQSLILGPTASTLNKAITITQSAAGAPPAAQDSAANSIIITGNVAAPNGYEYSALLVDYTVSGAAVTGVHEAIHGEIRLSLASNAGNTSKEYGGINGVASSTVNDGGTNLGAGAAGSLYALSGGAYLLNGATNFLNLNGMEIGIAAETGSSVKFKFGINVVPFPTDAVHAGSYEAAYGISSNVGAIGLNWGILFHDGNGQNALSTSATILGVAATGTVDKGIDLSAWTITTAAFKSTGFTVDGSGNTVFTAAAVGPTLKQGANGRVGTFVANGATAVTVNNTAVAITDAIIISLNTVGGTVGAVPALKTITAATGFTVAGTASDTSTYNYAIIKNAA